LLDSNISSTCPHNMVNFGPLAAQIGLVVWGTQANFNGFRVLASLLHGIRACSGRQPNFAALNRGRHLYSAGRPSRWALAHIVVLILFIHQSTIRTETQLDTIVKQQTSSLFSSDNHIIISTRNDDYKCLTRASVTLNSLSTYCGMLYSASGSTTRY